MNTLASFSPTTEELAFFFEYSGCRRIVSGYSLSKIGEVLSVHVKIQVYHVQHGPIILTGISRSP